MSFRPFTDEGHGGPYSPGTHDDVAVIQDDGSTLQQIDPNGLIEKDTVLDISDRLHASRGHLPFDVGRSRSLDTGMTQKDRGRASLKHRSTLVLSLHVNDNLDARARGAQLYVYPGNWRTMRLARRFAPRLSAIFGRCPVIEATKPVDEDQKWLNRPRSILLAHVCDVILFELGFRKDEADRKILMDELGREAIASVLRWCLVDAALAHGG